MCTFTYVSVDNTICVMLPYTYKAVRATKLPIFCMYTDIEFFYSVFYVGETNCTEPIHETYTNI